MVVSRIYGRQTLRAMDDLGYLLDFTPDQMDTLFRSAQGISV